MNLYRFLALSLFFLLTIGSMAQTTQVRAIHCDQVQPFLMEDNILADIVQGVDQYQFVFYDGVSNKVKTSNNYSVLLYLVPGLQYGVDYNVFVRTRTNGVWSAYGDTCQIEMATEIPTTKLRPQYCFSDNPFFLDANILTEYIYAADSYEFAFHDGTTEYIYPSSNYSFFLYEGPDLVSGVAYDVYVRSILSGDTSAWGDTCTVVVSSMVPIVNVREQYCMQDTLYELDNTLLADWTAGYDAYQWEFVNDDDTLTYVSDNYSIDIDEVQGVVMGQTYEVRVAAIIGSSVGDYGDPCYITTATLVPSSQLTVDYCDTDSLYQLTDVIYAEPVDPLVDEWVFFFDDGTTVIEYSSDTTLLSLATVPGLMPGVTYSVTVEAGVIGNYSLNGVACSLQIVGTAPPQPMSSSLTDDFCNSSQAHYLNDSIVAEEDSLAGAYIFYLFYGGDTIVYQSASHVVLLNDIPGLIYGVDYSVRVETQIAGVESTGGSPCDILMAEFPESTSLLSANCDSVYHFPSAEMLTCNTVYAATNYEFRFTQDFGTPLIGESEDELIGLDEVTGLDDGFYDVDVRAYAGATWSEWGSVCSIELNDSTVSSLSELYLPNLNVYPNPSSGELSVSGIDGLGANPRLSIISLTGQQLMQTERVQNGQVVIGTNIPAGVYMIRLEGEKGMVHRRWIRQD